jgi:hypothetical protein
VSILGVYDDFEGWSGNVEINPNTLRAEGTFDRPMCVEFSEDDASFKPITALYANGLPRPWDPIGPDYPFTYCIGYGSIKMDGPKIVRIVVRYKIWEDPLAIPPKKAWNIVRNSDVLQQGCRPGSPTTIMPVKNSANEPPDPPMMTDYHDLALRVSVNRAEYNQNLASRYMGAVNNDPFFGFPAGKVKCTLFTGEEQRAGGLIFWQHDYEFQIRTFDSDPLNIGWLRRFKDEGFRELLLNATTNEWEYKDILSEIENEDGTITKKPVSKPAPLDGAGREITPGSNTPDHYIEIQDFDQLPFSVLGLE